MKEQIVSKCIALLLCLIAVVSLPLSASAVPTSTNTGSVTVEFQHKGYPIKDAQFRIYLIATETANGYALTGDFTNYSVSLDNLNSDALNGLATALAAYVARDSVNPTAQGKTNSQGDISFSDLEEGLYLIIGDPVTEGSIIYTPQSFIVAIPYVDANGKKVYDVVSEPKQDIYNSDAQGATINRTVRKVWENTGSKNRMNSVVIQLLKNGQVYDEVTLDATNGWEHSWKDLDVSYRWQVVEKAVPARCTISVAQDGVTFIVTNTYDTPDTPTSDPDSPGNPTNPSDPSNPSNPTTPSDPSNPSNPANPSNPTNPGGPSNSSPNLPQTGQLWWPVPVFVSVGVIFFALGIVLKKRNENET